MSIVKLLPDSKYVVSKIICVACNYTEHIAELNSIKSEEPILFLKPPSAILNEGEKIILPSYSKEIHHEVELALLVSKKAKSIKKEDWESYIIGAGIALDLTLRDLQRHAREKGNPWSIAKGFDGACPISNFKSIDQINDLQNLDLCLQINDNIKQTGNTKDMIFPIDYLVSYISTIFTLEAGDIILTGTPAGVSPIYKGDRLKATISEIGSVEFLVKE
jgi:5-carboxymethyl-2-hydroxymuconate isomerase